MKPEKILVPILFAASLAGCNQAPTGAAPKPDDAKPIDSRAQDIADVKAVEDRFVAAFKAKDVNAIIQLCLPDDSLVVFDVHPPRQYNGPQAYRKDWEKAFNSLAGPLDVQVSDLDVTAGAEVAFVRSIHHVTGTTKGGKKRDYTVRVTDGLKKINGQWLIVHTHVSVPVEMQSGKADFESKP